MLSKSSEWSEIIYQFEKDVKKKFYNVRFDKEPVEFNRLGRFYKCGRTNDIFNAFLLGYAYGKNVFS